MQAYSILAISGSLRTDSTNSAIVRAIAGMAPADVEITIYPGLGDLPHYNPELDTDTPPASVADLRARITLADGVLICTPEYAFGMPGSLKNMLDWLVSSGEFLGKLVVAISASPLETGGASAHEQLVKTLRVLTADVVMEGSMPFPFVRRLINGAGAVTNDEAAARLRAVLDALLNAVRSRAATGTVQSETETMPGG